MALMTKMGFQTKLWKELKKASLLCPDLTV